MALTKARLLKHNFPAHGNLCQKTFRYLWRFYSLLFRGFSVVFSRLFRGPLLSRKTVFGRFSWLFRGFFVAFSWPSRGPHFGQILRVLALEKSSDFGPHRLDMSKVACKHNFSTFGCCFVGNPFQRMAVTSKIVTSLVFLSLLFSISFLLFLAFEGHPCFCFSSAFSFRFPGILGVWKRWKIIVSSRGLVVSNLVVCNLYAEALFCPFWRSFADLRLRSVALICVSDRV